MNNILQLKGTFEQKTNPSGFGASNLPRNGFLEVVHLEKLKKELELLHNFWENEIFLNGALISVYYKNVVAKSRRIYATFARGKITANSTIVGAKFSKGGKLKHIITHYISKEILTATIKKYADCIAIISTHYNGMLSYDDIVNINTRKIIHSPEISRTNFVQIVVDAYYVEQFFLDMGANDFKENSIISIYKTDIGTEELMAKLGISLLAPRLLDETTMLLTPDQLLILKQKAPYLISMGVSDISQLIKSDFAPQKSEDKITIPSPTNEPTIGVIDTLFDESVYFSEWVEYKMMVDPNIPISDEDYDHGTAISSIIVDGVSINPHLEDGCGRFKVRHFGVATASFFSSFSILRRINEIITTNRDIKVWNLSLGAVTERVIHPKISSLLK